MSINSKDNSNMISMFKNDDISPFGVKPKNFNFTAIRYTGKLLNKIKLYEFIYGTTPDIFDFKFLSEPKGSIKYLSITENKKVFILSLTHKNSIVLTPSSNFWSNELIQLEVGDYVIRIEENSELKGFLVYTAEEFLSNFKCKVVNTINFSGSLSGTKY